MLLNHSLDAASDSLSSIWDKPIPSPPLPPIGCRAKPDKRREYGAAPFDYSTAYLLLLYMIGGQDLH